MLAKSASLRPAPRLYLATPEIDDPARIMTPLADALASADVAAVLMRLAPSDPRTMMSRIKVLAPLIQNSGAAVLLDGHADLVAGSGADGAHLTGIEALQEAMPPLKPDRIVGVGGLSTRQTPWSLARPAPTTCCSASRIRPVIGRPRKRLLIGWHGGPNCSAALRRPRREPQ